MLKARPTKRLDFLGIGDVVTDTFIELIDAWIEDDNPQKNKELCMRFGSKIPYRNEVNVNATGNASNAAHAAMRLGLSAGLCTDIGSDEAGEKILAGLKSENINSDYVTKHSGQTSNHNYILRFREERTILVHHNEYEYKLPEISPAPRWIYLSSLAHNSINYHHQISDYLREHPETKFAFQPGTFQIKLGILELRDLYERSDLFFCNLDEARRILQPILKKELADKIETQSKIDQIKTLLSELHAVGPKIVVVTDGPNGAYVYDGDRFLFGPMYPDPLPPVDRTGAGDSFSATFTTAIALGRSIEKALQWGPINSMSVVQKIGAQAGHLTQGELLDLLGKKPSDYEPREI